MHRRDADKPLGRRSGQRERTEAPNRDCRCGGDATSVRHRLVGSKIRVDALCGAWVAALGTALAWWNLQAGYTTRAQAVGVLMALGIVIYLGDIVSTIYGGEPSV